MSDVTGHYSSGEQLERGFSRQVEKAAGLSRRGIGGVEREQGARGST